MRCVSDLLDNNIKAKKKTPRLTPGTQTYCIDYDETFAQSAKYKSLCTVLTIAASNKWILKGIDVENAFVEAPIDRPIFMNLPTKTYAHESGKPITIEIQKSLYGLKQAPELWDKFLCKAIELQPGQPIARAMGTYVTPQQAALLEPPNNRYLIQIGDRTLNCAELAMTSPPTCFFSMANTAALQGLDLKGESPKGDSFNSVTYMTEHSNDETIRNNLWYLVATLAYDAASKDDKGNIHYMKTKELQTIMQMHA